MRTVKVLYLDAFTEYLPDLTPYGVNLEVFEIEPVGTFDHYCASPQLCETVEKLTADKQVDIVVVGNNLGVGVTKAKAIAVNMQEMTVVVWNSYYRGQERPYADLGFRRFGSREDLLHMIPEMLGINV